MMDSEDEQSCFDLGLSMNNIGQEITSRRYTARVGILERKHRDKKAILRIL
jgi:hypothetical protein